MGNHEVALSSEQFGFLGSAVASATDLLHTIEQRDAPTAERIFSSDNQRTVRIGLLAGKLVEHVVDTASNWEADAGTSLDAVLPDTETLVDALIDLSPAPKESPRRIEREQQEIASWFGVELHSKEPANKSLRKRARAKRGDGIVGLLKKHEFLVAQRQAEAQRRATKERGVEPVLIKELEGANLVELKTAEHLSEESRVSDNCIGRTPRYRKRMAAGKARYFSIRPHEDGEPRITIDFLVDDNAILTATGRKNEAMKPDHPQRQILINALLAIRENIADQDREFVMRGLELAPNTVLMTDGTEKDWRTISTEDHQFVLSGNVVVDESEDVTTFPGSTTELLARTGVSFRYCKKEQSEDDIKFLQTITRVGGDITFDSCGSSVGLENLTRVEGSANFYKLLSAEGLSALKHVGVNANFKVLRDSTGLEKLEYVGQTAQFENLFSPRGFRSLAYIGGGANFGNIRTAEGLERLRYIGEDAHFTVMQSAVGLDNLEQINGSATFHRLRNSNGLGSLRKIKKDVVFLNLRSASGLTSLQSVGGNARFSALRSAIGLEKLEEINGSAIFTKLVKAKGLGGLKVIGGTAEFRNLKTAKGLEGLVRIGMSAKFFRLISGVGLDNLQTIEGTAHFDDLAIARGLEKLRHIGKGKLFKVLPESERDLIPALASSS